MNEIESIKHVFSDEQREAFMTWAAYVYYVAYHAGHHDTVEGTYTHVMVSDGATYWRDAVEELLDIAG